MIRQYELVDRVLAYDRNADEAGLNRAYVYGTKMHGHQTRHSGDPYFSHPIEVAGILTDLKLDSDTIITALLHDTVEDTDATLEEIRGMFGERVAGLVDGVTKLSLLELSSEETKQAENFRKFMMAMSKDVRVLLVKLADRLHNMRTLSHHPREASRKRIAQETIDIYAPLAGRIGMQDFRDELEDLAFQEINPGARESILKRLEFLTKESDGRIDRICNEITQVLSAKGIEARVVGRQKKPFSIWRKLQRKEITFEELPDIMGFRVICKSVDECYRALGVVHQRWRIVPGRFKDYVSTPKSNGYQSIHTTVWGPERQKVELQIRTQEMHDVAEHGVAAHWSYKDQPGKNGNGAGKVAFDASKFLNRISELLAHEGSPEEFLENSKLELFLDQVFCFTPKGDLIALPKGATPVDFAYAVHTDVGDTCVGAKVNGATVPLHTILRNGDAVEILRSKAQTPEPMWAEIVVTGKARSAIRRFIRESKRTDFVKLGRQLVATAFESEEQELTEKALSVAAERLSLPDVDEMLFRVGSNVLGASDVFQAVFPGFRSRARRARDTLRSAVGLSRTEPKSVPIKGLKAGLAVHFAQCCHPIPGDRIVGILESGKGIIVHTIDCGTLAKHQESGEEWIDLAWQSKEDAGEIRMVGRLRVVLNNEMGALAALTSRIAEYEGNIMNMNFAERREDFFNVEVDIEVEDVKHLSNIVAALRASELIKNVRRMRG
ncbi:MAG: bifunctional (p)ppGpp synthetase/guanosine-3',5'-bis(diphosphate) 3'-pyrophosphohydrolase [Alphaproteobacteria bacterium]|nr:MAG: bifunctional (p)ppGpp synthetase/guanosine-3',5'-bis(diphosphate) 3'-pyrophosphohydrolase [Alphaproteobacteria bacterium]